MVRVTRLRRQIQETKSQRSGAHALWAQSLSSKCITSQTWKIVRSITSQNSPSSQNSSGQKFRVLKGYVKQKHPDKWVRIFTINLTWNRLKILITTPWNWCQQHIKGCKTGRGMHSYQKNKGQDIRSSLIGKRPQWSPVMCNETLNIIAAKGNSLSPRKHFLNHHS